MNRSEAGRLGYAVAKHTHEQNFRIRVEGYYSNPKLCPYCSQPLTYEQAQTGSRFCSHSCAASSVQKGRKKAFCKDCGLKYRADQSWFCEDCGPRHRAKYHLEWGNPNLGKGSYKKLLIRDNGRKCGGCSLANWLGNKIPLEMHHVDGDADNWAKENLILLCPNCHSLTPNYRSKNLQASKSRRRRRPPISKDALIAQ